ncbi:hypothetical protein SDC9_184307 [bioreactor metagenome]|uniref:Uncharacterized protein n=1 Tax=bioreactor metagenome TaxID=1076179 RepID=A0A645HE39_9ZZZZ
MLPRRTSAASLPPATWPADHAARPSWAGCRQRSARPTQRAAQTPRSPGWPTQSPTAGSCCAGMDEATSDAKGLLEHAWPTSCAVQGGQGPRVSGCATFARHIRRLWRPLRRRVIGCVTCPSDKLSLELCPRPRL